MSAVRIWPLGSRGRDGPTGWIEGDVQEVRKRDGGEKDEGYTYGKRDVDRMEELRMCRPEQEQFDTGSER